MFNYRNAFFLMLFVALATFGFAWRQYQGSERLAPDRFVEYSHEPQHDLVIARWKDTRELAWDGSDRNGDLADDSVVYYAKGSRTQTVIMDNNFDGRFERTVQYSKHERMAEGYWDKNKDGYFEHYYLIGTDSADHFIDSNEDGHYEPSERTERVANDALPF